MDSTYNVKMNIKNFNLENNFPYVVRIHIIGAQRMKNFMFKFTKITKAL